MNKKGKTAILLGATGLTGSILLDLLSEDPNFAQIKIFSRSNMDITSDKVQLILCDLLILEEQKEAFVGDVVFCCIGTTTKKTPDRKLYKEIDYGIPVRAAELSELNGIKQFIVVSSMGANAKSKLFYSRTKGQMEEAVLEKKIDRIHILRPSLILGKRSENRLGEGLAQKFDRVFGFMLGKKLRGIQAEEIAHCMQVLALNEFNEKTILSDQIRTISHNS